MSAFVRWLVGLVIFAALLLAAGALLGIRPTWQEVVPIVLASSFASGVKEGLR